MVTAVHTDFSASLESIFSSLAADLRRGVLTRLDTLTIATNLLRIDRRQCYHSAMSRRERSIKFTIGLRRRLLVSALLLIAFSMMIAACFSAVTKPFQAVGAEMADVATHVSMTATPQAGMLSVTPTSTTSTSTTPTSMPTSTVRTDASVITESVGITASHGGLLARTEDELTDLLILTTTRPITAALTTTTILTVTEPLTTTKV